MEKPAVYLIRHRDSGKVYVGSTANLSKRWSRHRQELRDGTHKNQHLQAAWNLYGEAAFGWSVLALVEPSERIWLEQRAIDVLDSCDPARGYNRERRAGVTYGGAGRVWTPELREKVSRAQRTSANRLAVGEVCGKGHVVDGSYVYRRVRPTGEAVYIRCQDCYREAARERQRRLRGIPADHPKGKHYNRRGRNDAADH